MLVSENSLLSKNSHKSSFNNDNNSVSYPSRTIVHPKLEMTEPGDADEQEADVAANEVMSGKVFRKFSGGGAGGGMAVSSQMESQLNQLQGGGQAMPDGLRGMMERGFDRDFSQVRLHTDGEAAGLSSSIHAKAFTHGNDIYFNQGQYAPETSEGQRLVAHELAHVAQGRRLGRDVFISEEKDEEKKETQKVILVLYESSMYGSESRKEIAIATFAEMSANLKIGMKNEDIGEISKYKKNREECHHPKPKGNYYHEGGELDSKEIYRGVLAPFYSVDELPKLINEQSNIVYLAVFTHSYPTGITSLNAEKNHPKGFTFDLVKKIDPESFVENANIYLNGCRAGYYDNSIAQAMATHLTTRNVAVWAFETGVDYPKNKTCPKNQKGCKRCHNNDYNGRMDVTGTSEQANHRKFSGQNGFKHYEISSLQDVNNGSSINVTIDVQSEEIMGPIQEPTLISASYALLLNDEERYKGNVDFLKDQGNLTKIKGPIRCQKLLEESSYCEKYKYSFNIDNLPKKYWNEKGYDEIRIILKVRYGDEDYVLYNYINI